MIGVAVTKAHALGVVEEGRVQRRAKGISEAVPATVPALQSVPHVQVQRHGTGGSAAADLGEAVDLLQVE